MSRYVWLSPAATAAINAMSTSDRATYERVIGFIADFPRPIRATTFIERATWFGRDLFRYWDDDFPYQIWYDLNEEDEDITVLLVLRAATKRTPL